MAFKSQLGYGSMRVHDVNRIYGKFFVAFVSCVIRYFLFTFANSIKLDTNSLIRKLNLLEIIHDRVFTYPHQESADICKMLNTFGSSNEIFDEAKDRANTLYYGHEATFRHRKTRITSKKQSVAFDENFNPIPRKRGVPVGTRRSDTNKDGSPRKKPGPRPKSPSNSSCAAPSTDGSAPQEAAVIGH